MATEAKIALFIDADNISAKYGKAIIETLQSRGEIFIRRIYGNWEKNSLHGWNENILKFGLLAVQQMDFTSGKNATDMSLTIDAMDVLYQHQADTFALVSGDSDFTPLAVRLRERGVYVIGMGNSKASTSLQSACNEFINLDSVIKNDVRVEENFTAKDEIKTEVKETPQRTKKISSVGKTARKFVSKPKKLPATKKIVASKTATKTRRIEISSEKDLIVKEPNEEKIQNALSPKVPAPTSKVLKTAAQKNSVGKKMTLEERFIKCGRDGMKNPKRKLQQIHEVLRDSAKVHADKNGFSPLNCAGHDLKQKNLGFGIKDFGYSLLNEFIGDFPEMYELKSIGRGFRYRCL